MKTTKQDAASAELAAVLEKQTLIESIHARISATEAAIAPNEARLAKALEAVPDVETIEQQRESLLAAEASGQVSAAEREGRERELDATAGKARAGALEKGKIAARIEATLRGLRGQRERDEAALQEAIETKRAALAAFLEAEAERVGKEYVDAARTLYPAYLRLMALSDLLRSATGGTKQFRRTWQFYLPAFDLRACDGLFYERRTGLEYFREDELVTVGDPGWAQEHRLSDADQQERERLTSLGITLG